MQTQAPAQAGSVSGRTISDTFYDSSGRVVKTNAPYFDSTAPSGTLNTPADNSVPGQTVTTYDGQGRPTVQAFRQLGVEPTRSTTPTGRSAPGSPSPTSMATTALPARTTPR